MEDDCRAMLFEMNGVLIRSAILTGVNHYEWDTHGLSSGIYLLKVESRGNFTMLKIVL